MTNAMKIELRGIHFQCLFMLIVAFSALLAVAPARAHAVGTSYLHIDGAKATTLPVRAELSLRDLEFAVGLDADTDGRITWGEVLANGTSLSTYVARHLTVRRGTQPCLLGAADIALDKHADELYVVLATHATCAETGALSVQSNLLFEIDDSHRSLLSVANGEAVAVSVLTNRTRTWASDVDSSAWQDFVRFVGQGVWHIWIGFDHLAFLMLLLLPLARAAINVASTANWVQIKEILKVVTAFTAAHSITLVCATLGLLHFSSRWVEAIIAASIVVAALANIANVAPRYGAVMAFGFGLIHGLGFASALADITTSTASRVIPLIGFNLGVELGQLAVVAAVFPLLFLWRGSPPIKDRAILAGSIAIGAAGITWFLQRTVLS